MVDLINPIVRRWIEDGKSDPEGFWSRAAAELPWFRRWDRAFVWEPPTFRWFDGGMTNLCWNALDHHVECGRGAQAALIALNERGERRTFTYSELLSEVRNAAAALRGIGVGRGDRITIYMPTMAEAVILMLAAVRIGAIHMVVFAGFGERALGDRIRASGSIAVFTANVTYRKGKDVRLKEIVDASLELEGEPHAVRRVVVLDRTPAAAPMRAGRDLSWQEFLSRGEGRSGAGDHEEMESNEPAFILATSGTTAKPKLAVHTQGGYQVHVSAMGKWCLGMRAGEIWWSTSDIGWIVGHSYIVYAPLLAGCTTLAYEGSIDHPAPDALWKIVEEFGVTGIFTSPTAVRLLMRYGDSAAAGADLSTLERVFCAGEVLNAPAWDWLQNRVLRGRVPVIDHMWQTETSGPVFGNPYGISLLPIKPGSSTVPLPGIDSAVIGPDGEPCAAGEKGIMVIKRPFPGLTASLWGEPERYGRDYWEKIPGVYYTGDSAHVDEDGYVWFAGRADEIIKIAAHRVGTIEVETACLQHPSVAEAGVTGRPDELRGEVISAFVVLKQGIPGSAALRQEILKTIRRELGAVAVIGELNFVHMLPKTRSGKIMRRVLKAVTLGRDPGDITTIEDEGSVEEAREAWLDMRESLK
ncbi:MAG: acetate--CoA ligase [Acidobacteriota bacterium]|nr:acetate--CoA ligase [Acidobacteriota bacterium]